MTNFREHFQNILEHNESRMPKLFSILKNYSNPYVGVHFSKISQVSLNPKPFHRDPIGVYTFPRQYIIDGKLKNNTGFSKYPFIFVIAPTDSAKILNLDMSAATAKKLLDSMEIPTDIYDKTIAHYNYRESHLPGEVLWDSIERWIEDNKLPRNSAFNKLIKKTGYNVIYDPGLKIIHYNESSQIVFLEPGTYKVLDIITNNLAGIIPLLRKEFYDFKITNKTNKFAESYYYYFECPESKKYFSIELSKLNNDITVSTYDSLKTYSEENNFSEIVDYIKHTLATSNSIRHEELDYSKSPIAEIAKLYGFSFDERTHKIDRNYKSKSAKINLNINYYPATSYSPDSSLNIILKKDGPFSSFDNYYYYDGIKNPIGSPEEMVKKLLDSIEESAKEDSQLTNFDSSYKGQIALKDIAFLRNRVFIKRRK